MLYLIQRLTTSFGLEVTWNGHANVQTKIATSYWNSTCGLCGTYDGDPSNDFITPENLLVSYK